MPTTSTPAVPQVLVVDDNPGGQPWLFSLIQRLGGECIIARDERAARGRLDEVRRGEASYLLAVVDVMVRTHSNEDLDALDDAAFEREYQSSQDTGIRLCDYARNELKLNGDQLPIIAVTVRDDEAVTTAMKRLGIELFSRADGGSNSAREHIKRMFERRSIGRPRG